MRKRQAFSLVEILIVIAIILTIAAIVTPAYSRAKYGALRTSDISNLRQIGVAAELYAATYDEWSYGVRPLVDSELIPKVLLSAATDRHPAGAGNLAAISVSNRPDPYYPYRVSYVSQHDYGIQVPELKYPGAFPNTGWLVLLVDFQDLPPPMVVPERDAAYVRLSFDGSVSKRLAIRRPSRYGDRSGEGWHPAFLFADGDERWYDSLLTPDP